MEFLDPAGKRARTIKLFVGYALLAIVVALTTLILVYQTQGYGYNRDKGVTRSGLLFVDSKPVSATVTLDNLPQDDRTAARFNVGEGEHAIVLSADNYRDWTKKFVVEGGSVKYLLYPRLFPKDIPVSITRVFATTPAWASQSLDRNWLVLQQNPTAPVLTIIDMLNTGAEPSIAALPATVVVPVNGNYGTLKPIEWAEDNKHLLLLHTQPNGNKNYIIYNRENSDASINITQTLKLSAEQSVTLRDKKYDKYYVFAPKTGEIRTADVKAKTVSNAFISGAISFKGHGDNLVLYATSLGADTDEAKIYVVKDQKDSYQLQTVTRDPNGRYLLDMAKFKNNWFYVVGSPASNAVRIYRDPLTKSNPNNNVPIQAQMSLRITNPQFVSFSDNARNIAIQSGRQFVVFDAEENRIFRYTSPLAIGPAAKAPWMDGHRLSAVTDGAVHVFDFDGTNLQKLVASKPEFSGYFDRDYKVLYSFITQADGKTGFQNAQLVVDQ